MKALSIVLVLIGTLSLLSLIIIFSGSSTDGQKNSFSDELKNGGVPYVEFVNPHGYVNTDGKEIKLADYVGRQVILLDIMTYSCINCQRTFPYLKAWYEEYQDDGLIVIGIHTPEFAFEKDKGNVEKAMDRFGLDFPIILDNNYETWRAYKNNFWPHKYLIDINGNIVYEHVGEGAYAETEEKIRELLLERAEMLDVQINIKDSLASDAVAGVRTLSRSPETYFGSKRNEFLANGVAGQSGPQTMTLPEKLSSNSLYLKGTWNMSGEYAEATDGSEVHYLYNAKEVYIVAEAENGGTIVVKQDGNLVGASGGEDVQDGVVEVNESRLYKLIKNDSREEHTLELEVSPGVKLFAFTFG